MQVTLDGVKGGKLLRAARIGLSELDAASGVCGGMQVTADGVKGGKLRMWRRA